MRKEGSAISTGFSPRGVLFVPAHSTDKFGKVGRSGPDAVVVDVEDAVPPDGKDAARRDSLAALADARPDAETVLMRINGVATPWYGEDVAAVAKAVSDGVLDGVVLPKYERVSELARLRAALPSGALVVVGLESAFGVADARELLAAGPDAAYFGAEDYIADLGGRRTAAGAEVLYARSQVCLAARLGGVASLDQVVVAVRDAAAFRADAQRGLELGFRGKLCLHPIQVSIANEVFSPSESELVHARAVLAAATAAGVAVLDGQMVDAVHLTMARATLARAHRTRESGISPG